MPIFSWLDLPSDSKLQLAEHELIVKERSKILLPDVRPSPLGFEHGQEWCRSFLICDQSYRSGFVRLIQQLVAKGLHLCSRRLESFICRLDLCSSMAFGNFQQRPGGLLVGLCTGDSGLIPVSNFQRYIHAEHDSVVGG